MIGWAEDWKVGLVHIQPGRPMQNGHVESFHGRLRDECLNATWFRTLNDVRCTLATWREEYNCERPHSSLDYRTPQEFRQQLGYADVESIQRFPHPHSLGGGEIVSTQNKTEKLQLSMGEKRGQVMDMLGEAVEQSAGQPFRAEDLGPFGEGQVAGDHGGTTLVALAEHLEEQLGTGLGERHEAEFIDDDSS